MDSSLHLTRAQHFIQQHRWDLAEKDLRLALAEQPDDPYAMSLLGWCLNERKEYAEARRLIQEAVQLNPENHFTHYVLATTLFDQNHYPDAEQSIGEALRLAPYQSNYHALKGRIAFAERRWQDAVESAEAGLEADPEDDDCINLRAMALVKLGRRNDADVAIRSSLERDPENAYTHANMGWTYLEKGESQKALEHFREALRIAPELEWARMGIVEAMKARFFVYSLLLRFFLWTSRLSSRAQWALIIGGWIGARYLRQIADANPDMAPWIYPIFYAYLSFIVLTWIGPALSNLALRLNRFGRLALSQEEIVTSNWIGGTLLLALAFLSGYLIGGLIYGLFGAVMCGLLSFPISRIYSCDPGWPRTTLLSCTILLGTLALFSVSLIAIAFHLLDAPTAGLVGGLGVSGFYLYCLSILVLQFVIHWLMSAVVRR